MFSSFRGYLLYLNLIIALPVVRSLPASIQTPTIRNLYQFPNNTWVENLAVRSSGDLLLTLMTTPTLYHFDPLSQNDPVLVATFPDATSALGITEMFPDIFAVVVGNWSAVTSTTTPGSYSIWKVDVRAFSNETGKGADVTKIRDIPEANLLNGMTLASPASSFLLIGDLGLGVIWRMEWASGKYDMALNSSLLTEVNGIHTRQGHLYFTTSFQETFGRVSIHENGTQAGDFEIIGSIGFGDDFCFDQEGNAYVAQDLDDALKKITPEGDTTVVVSSNDSTLMFGDTAVKFGRTEKDISSKRAYVVTNGGLNGKVEGVDIVGGMVLSVDLFGN